MFCGLKYLWDVYVAPISDNCILGIDFLVAHDGKKSCFLHRNLFIKSYSKSKKIKKVGASLLLLRGKELEIQRLLSKDPVDLKKEGRKNKKLVILVQNLTRKPFDILSKHLFLKK